MKKNHFYSILKIFAMSIFFGCNQGGSTNNVSPNATPEELKANLKMQEQSNPVQYLTAQGTMEENKVQTRSAGLFHEAEYSTDGYFIQGTIKNSASVARFKDVHLVIKFLSKTNTVIDTKEFVQYEFYEPNSTKGFSIHAYPPEEMVHWSIEIISATAAE
ncbi:MAG: hypothetical protein NT084_13315 [Bacteroidetes bacterium]|nr:hypothetical protein [Bacteroidota bacterium]